MAQMAIPDINIEYYMNLAVRRKWWIIVPVLLSILAGAVYIKITPKSYQANTLILVQAQKVPSSYVTSTVTESLQSRLHTITQQVYSRTNLEKIIKQFDLADNADREEKPTAKIVENLRRRININLRGKGRTQAFEISFLWHDPKTVAIVTNAVASQFIEQNLKVREDMAMGTTAFLENESEKMRRKLEAQEKTLKLFNKEHMGMLPSERQSNLNILGQLKEELNHLETRIQSENERAVMLQKQAQMLQIVQMQSSDLFEIVSDEEGVVPSEDITYLESQLRQLRLRYTEKHPDVVALKRKISIIQQMLDADMNEEELSMPEPVEDSLDQLDNPMVFQQDQTKFQLETINKNIESYQKKISDVKKEIKFYNNRIERIPEVELELTKLTRDYSTMRSRYQTLLQKKIDARMAEQLERRQKGEQFKVIDPAITPDKPVKPDVKKVILIALMAGLGIGCGLAYLREIIDGSFYSTDDLESFLGSKVLVSIPFLKGNI